MQSFSLLDSYFEEILPKLNDADMIKLMLYIEARIQQQEGEHRYLFAQQILQSNILYKWFEGNQPEERIRQSLRKAITNHFLLSFKHNSVPGKIFIFTNTEEGQTALKELQDSVWLPTPTDQTPELENRSQKNIYQLYEENIGPLTPLLAEDLTAAQEEFSLAWIEDAIRVAVQNNARSWRYIDAVLKSWQKEGKNVKFRRDSETNESEHSKGQFDDFVQH